MTKDRKRILVIDDEALIRRTLADYLTECGYETAAAIDGADGLTQARAEQFHAVLVDLRMPRVDGLEVIAALKAEQPELPTVVVSGTGVLGDAIQAIRRGAVDYITKPIQDMDEIAVVVERVLERAALLAERNRYQSDLERLNRSLEAEVLRQTQHLRSRNRELSALNYVSYAISDPLDLDTMLNRAIDAAVTAIEADSGVVRLLNPATGCLVVAASRGLPASYLTSSQAIPLGDGVIGHVAQSGHPHAGKDFADDPWMAPLQDEGFCSYMCVPLRSGDEAALLAEAVWLSDAPPPAGNIVGTLGIAMRTEHDFDSSEVRLLASIGNQIGVAVARAQYAANLKQANAKLERINAELRHLDTMREQFIQNVAHELRTPLALILGYIEMLVQGDLAPEERQMALGVTSRRVRALAKLVDSITTLQDLSNEPLRIESIAPEKLLQTVLQMSRQQAMMVDVKLHSTCSPDLSPFPGDFTRLAQALHQLLDNACKFSPKGSTVGITFEATPTRDGVRISVTDQGIGIPLEEHTRIFDRFYQVDGSSTRHFGGTGLGLAIVQEIVVAHGGRVDVESDEGQGATFIVTLPIG